ncbi:MAG TPA: GNAT family N-acetyltransferase [Bryobacteraceae bacterium]|jgi:ribosomal-protein-alanine N-acetyltransferase|nr:GNAT family N-acetyltransferase [Bryobacteraceae bacterium]
MFERFETPRLILRKPCMEDADDIFYGWASDAEVTRWVAFRRHGSVEDTRAFLERCEAERIAWPFGAILIESRADGRLLGSTGLDRETAEQASTGYVLARHAWGFGYATEALTGVIELAQMAGVRRLWALCHPANHRSIRVLEKCGFRNETLLERHNVFPNSGTAELQDAYRFERKLH